MTPRDAIQIGNPQPQAIYGRRPALKASAGKARNNRPHNLNPAMASLGINLAFHRGSLCS